MSDDLVRRQNDEPANAGRADAARSMYVAVILHGTTSAAPNYRPLYSETIVLIEAASLGEAEDKARAHGLRGEVSYDNEFGETITWSLKRVVDVNSVLDDELGDGAELYARHFRSLEAYDALEPAPGESS